MAEQPPQACPKYNWGDTPEEQEYYNLQNIESTSSFYTTPRNLTLFTRSWLPPSTTPTRGVICMVHGYGNDHSWIFQSIPIFLAQNGFACLAADHGQSPGLKAFVPNVDLVPLTIVFPSSTIQSKNHNSKISLNSCSGNQWEARLVY